MDYVSYCGGMPMAVIRVLPDPEMQDAILTAAADFERRIAETVAAYEDQLASGELRWVPTERVVEQEMF